MKYKALFLYIHLQILMDIKNKIHALSVHDLGREEAKDGKGRGAVRFSNSRSSVCALLEWFPS